MKACIRCGLTEKEVRKGDEGGLCCVYGVNYGNHKYEEIPKEFINDMKE